MGLICIPDILGRDSRNGSNVLHTAAAALGHPTTTSGDAVDDPSGPPRPHDDVFLPHVPPVGPLRYGVWFGDAPLEAIDQQQPVRSLVHLCFGTSFIRRGDDVRNDCKPGYTTKSTNISADWPT